MTIERKKFVAFQGQTVWQNTLVNDLRYATERDEFWGETRLDVSDQDGNPATNSLKIIRNRAPIWA